MPRLAPLKERGKDYWGAMEQLWNAFHNCSYGKFTNMESFVPKLIRKTLIVR